MEISAQLCDLGIAPERSVDIFSNMISRVCSCVFFFFFSSRRRHTRLQGDWSSDVCSSDLLDPDNKWLWRMNRRRLEIEPWRDALLATAGTLDRTVGGAPTDLAVAENRQIGRASCRERV